MDTLCRDEEQWVECWVCCDQSSSEPLIRPCKCRGTMTGVHATCMEKWISSQRVKGSATAKPVCPVCETPYIGMNTKPGLTPFVRKFGMAAAGLALRFWLYVSFMTSIRPKGTFCMSELIAIGAFYVFVGYKASVLTLSVARGCGLFAVFGGGLVGHPPGLQALRFYFCSSETSLRLQFLESAIVLVHLVAMICAEVVSGDRRFLVAFLILPPMCLLLCPILKVTIGPVRQDAATLQSILCALMVLLSVFTLFLAMAQGMEVLRARTSSDMVWILIWLLQALSNSSNALCSGPHILAVCAINVMFHFKHFVAHWVLLLIHSSIILGCFAYISISKQSKWYAGRGSGWLILCCSAWQSYHSVCKDMKTPAGTHAPSFTPNNTALVNMSLNCTNSVAGSQSHSLLQSPVMCGGASNENDIPPLGLETLVHLWFLALVALAIRVNWSLVPENYNAWQDRHSSFRFEASKRPGAEQHKQPEECIQEKTLGVYQEAALGV